MTLTVSPIAQFCATNHRPLVTLALVVALCPAALWFATGSTNATRSLRETRTEAIYTTAVPAVPAAYAKRTHHNDGDDDLSSSPVINATPFPLSFREAIVLIPTGSSAMSLLLPPPPLAAGNDSSSSAFGDYSFPLVCKQNVAWCRAADVNCSDFPILVVHACGLQEEVTSGAERLCRCHEKRVTVVPDVFLRADVHKQDVKIAALVRVKWKPSQSDRGDLVHLSRATVATQYNRCIGYDFRLGNAYRVVLAARQDVEKKRIVDVSGQQKLQCPPEQRVCAFYGFDSTAFNAGHALEAVVEALGQYMASGLHEQRVPWISFVWSHGEEPRATLHHRFLREILDVARIPIVELPFSRTVRLSRVAVAQLEFGKNSWCWRQVAHAFLLPLAQTEGARMFSPAGVPHALEDVAPGSTTPSLNKICLLKLHGDKTSLHRPGFHKTPQFSELLRQLNVTVLPVTLPILPRMFAINRAEVIVTSWGSTVTTVIHLLDAQRSNRRSNKTSSTPLLLVVLVHPDYIFEARFLFNRTGHALRRSGKKRVVTLHEHLTQQQSLMWDYYGGPHFCARFVLVRTLDQVDASDFASCRS